MSTIDDIRCLKVKWHSELVICEYMIGTSLKLCGKCMDIRYHAYYKYKWNRDSYLLCSEVNSSILGFVGRRGQDLCI
jgi:hypothetical protein